MANSKSLFLILLSIAMYLKVLSQDAHAVLLYEGNPGFRLTNEMEIKTFDQEGRLTHISGEVVPRLLVYKPEKACGTSVIICPGGGYSRMNVENSRFVADRLNSMGITAFVLVYRLPVKCFSSDKPVAAFADVQAAIRMVRRRADEWGLSPDKIGLLGSSAGGHLAAMAATHHTKSFLPGNDSTGLRPDFLILAWPVISFRPGLVHKGSMNNLLGLNPTEEQIVFNSPEEWVTGKTPPTFMVHAGDDTSVPVQNSIVFYQALKKAKVSAELHICETGGHGFGIAPDVKDSWMTQLEIWLRNRGIVKKTD